MRLEIHRLAAFARHPDSGNPAGVVVLDDWLRDDQMQAVAAEVGLSETAFLVRTPAGYHIRWFTPASEVPLCGHATLASGHYLNERGHEHWPLTLESASGPLIVSRDDDAFLLDFPRDEPAVAAVPTGLNEALGFDVSQYFVASNFTMALISDEEALLSVAPDFPRLGEMIDFGIIVTARGRSVDFVSRVFAPALGVDEDPVTGSAHCVTAPYWGRQLQTSRLSARQLSERGGDLDCELRGDRVLIRGSVVEIGCGAVTVPA